MARLQNVARAAELLRAEVSSPVFGDSAVALLDEIEAIRASAYAAVCELPASALHAMSGLLSAPVSNAEVRRRRARAYFQCLRAIREQCARTWGSATSIKARAGDWEGYYRWCLRRLHARWCLLRLVAYGWLYRAGHDVDIEDLIDRLSSLI